MPTIRARRGRMPSGAVRLPAASVVTVVTVVTLAVLLAGCGATDLPTPRRTVTVLVDAPGAATPTDPATPTSARGAATTPTPKAVPTALAVGRLRGAPKSFEEARARLDAAKGVAGLGAFRSPSGNIVCNLGADQPFAACEVESGRVKPPLPSICKPGEKQEVTGIELDPQGAFPTCSEASLRSGDEPKLPYGSRTADASSGVACISEEFGVTCVHTASHHGFFIARGSFVTF